MLATRPTDYDIWKETEWVLKKLPISAVLWHAQWYQDSMCQKHYQGQLPQDAFWNINMDFGARQAYLTQPT